MKNEEKIVELLTEVVRKQDQHEETLLKHTELLGQITERLNTQGEALGQITRILDGVAKKLSDTDDYGERLTKIEQHLGL